MLRSVTLPILVALQGPPNSLNWSVSSRADAFPGQMPTFMLPQDRHGHSALALHHYRIGQGLETFSKSRAGI